MKGRTDFHSHIINDPDEYKEVCYVVFEEDPEGKKTYDLTLGVFDDLKIAKEYATKFPESHVAIYSDYISGNYNYIQ